MAESAIFDISDAYSIRINFVTFSTTKIFFPKIPMKYSKNGQKFAMSKNISNTYMYVI